MIKKIKNFIAKIFGIKQCACKDEHLELYEDIPEPEIPVHKLEKIKSKILTLMTIDFTLHQTYSQAVDM